MARKSLNNLKNMVMDDMPMNDMMKSKKTKKATGKKAKPWSSQNKSNKKGKVC